MGLIQPVLPAPMSFHRTVELPGTGYRSMLKVYPAEEQLKGTRPTRKGDPSSLHHI